MGYVLQDRLELTLLVNNVEYPLDAVNLLHFMHIGFSTRTKIPTCHFAVSDARHSFDTINLADGVPISIAIKPLQGTTVYYNFRKFNHKKSFNGECFTYEIDGYYDSPLYWAGTTVAGMQGSSSDVLSSIAATCNLKFDGDTTSDAQLWIPRNQTYSEFVRNISDYGYITDESYMVVGLDPAGVLHYKDVNSLPTPTSTITLGQLIQGSYTASQYKPMSASGFTNVLQGYQHTRFDQSMVSPSLSVPYSQVTMSPDVTNPYINPSISSTIVSGYRSFGGIDVGNTHTSYEKALYQNQRFASTYSLAVEFLMLTPTNFTLFDRFTFSVDTENQSTDLIYAGSYTVAAKAIYVSGANYSEKILGVRQGTNQQSH